MCIHLAWGGGSEQVKQLQLPGLKVPPVLPPPSIPRWGLPFPTILTAQSRVTLNITPPLWVGS